MLGLCAYTGCSGDDDARKLLEQLAEGVTAMRTGTPWTWPFGAVLPAIRDIGKELGLWSPFEANSPVSIDFPEAAKLKGEVA